MKKDPKKKPDGKKPGFFKKISNTFNRVAKQKWGGIFRHTLSDLRSPKEILLLLGSSVVPGGWVGYGAYRIAKYKMGKKPANDDNPPPEGNKPDAQKAPKKGKKPKPPKPPQK
ncbi:MAG: hypothetical protein GC185_04555 [Alphaproteobacteria bacterium]|nr:hypothetical protein [Alphaproteobacteria bacterium]